MLKPRIETKPAIPLLGLHTIFVSGLSEDTDAPEKIGGLWSRLHERMSEIPAVEPGVSYGWIQLDSRRERERDDELDYVAGVEVAPATHVPGGMVSTATLPGLYAVFEHHGPMWTFRDTLLRVYREWLPNSEYVGARGDLERYGPRWSPDGEDSVFEYWVGIQPKA